MLCAVIQMTSTVKRPENLEQAAALLASASSSGAKLAVLPEHFSYLDAMDQMPAVAEPLKGPTVKFLASQAKKHGLWIIGGSFARKSLDPARAYNTCPVLDPSGELRAFYDKVHMFDLALPGQAAWEESRFVKNGRRLVTVDTPAGLVGLSICYDLRFPELYRRLRLKGATILAAPSAFTHATGKVHWEILARARAVENACYVLAAAQVGLHGGRRRSWGQAMIVDPWGEVLAQCGSEPGVALARVEPRGVERARRKLDSTNHARLLPRAWHGR
ncbi:MAG: carbon-nitrogen hydrolase family protein [Desulfarculaceae bacterium]|nr:carbon-nitrogen hydrolase family protein [Desulfarculaceae bacterium]MCF8072226.1 carbon-nitrogen hydrolase family protein [Desulfarculaceae bacterium]MCF8100147.1 carbon-nitrogen hydrolase family protein [Desulfarculaceae bacterium]MCF8117204.1 carbon-nitrogen hydrolase family protein [Desulfarculaceae bacterium]